MAKSAMEMLGIQQETLAQVEPEEVYEGKTLPSALYTVAVDKAYIRKTDSGANMLEVDFKLEGGEDFHYSTCVLSGDEKGNKSTYTQKNTNKEIALPGVVSMTKFLTAINSITAPAAKGDVEHKGNKIEALCFAGLQGKKLQIGVNQEESFYQGDVLLKNDIKYWLDEAGKNSTGEDLTDKVKESLEKHPLKKLKANAGANAPAAGATAGNAEAPKAGSGW